MYTTIGDRTLWFDGTITIDPNKVADYLHLDGIHVTHMTEDVEQYNFLAEKKLTLKEEIVPFQYHYDIPDEFKQLDVEALVYEKLHQEVANMSDKEALLRINRVVRELDLFKTHNLCDLLRTLVYVINKLTAQSVPWGVGRGSSVSSYILYLVGAHDVDSVLYDLDIADFIK